MVETGEIPKIEGGQFSPSVVEDVARNIIAFLRRNATREGHTYWLFKGDSLSDTFTLQSELLITCSSVL